MLIKERGIRRDVWRSECGALGLRGIEAGVRGVRGGQARFGGLARHGGGRVDGSRIAGDVGIEVVAPANVAVVVRADPLVAGANGGLDPLGGLIAICLPAPLFTERPMTTMTMIDEVRQFLCLSYSR